MGRRVHLCSVYVRSWIMATYRADKGLYNPFYIIHVRDCLLINDDLDRRRPMKPLFFLGIQMVSTCYIFIITLKYKVKINKINLDKTNKNKQINSPTNNNNNKAQQTNVVPYNIVHVHHLAHRKQIK